MTLINMQLRYSFQTITAIRSTFVNCKLKELPEPILYATISFYVQLGAFATTYLSTRSLADISNFTSADVSLVGHLLCGFTTVQLAAIPAATIG